MEEYIKEGITSKELTEGEYIYTPVKLGYKKLFLHHFSLDFFFDKKNRQFEGPAKPSWAYTNLGGASEGGPCTHGR